MANILSLHQRRVFLPSGDDARYAKLYVSATGTNTAVDTFSDEALSVQQSRPVVANAYGVFPAVYVEAGASLRILITDENDVSLPGYPQDDIVPHSADVQGAGDVTFNPTEALPYTNAQAAIEGAAALSTDQLANSERSLTPWNTGGSSNDFTITPSPAIEAYGAYQAFVIRPNRANTGAATLNVNGLGARDLVVIGTSGSNRNLVAGEIQTGREFMVYYDGTRFYATLGRGYATVVNDLLAATTKASMRAATDSIIGTHVLAYDADLSAIGALGKANGNFIVGGGSAWVAESGATARASLGLGSAAVLNANAMGNITVSTINAGSGSTSAPAYSSTSDPNSGLRVAGNGDWWMVIDGTDKVRFRTVNTTVVGTLIANNFQGSAALLTDIPGAELPNAASAVGTTALAVCSTAGAIAFGTTVAGSTLTPCDVDGVSGGGSLTGTWRNMGRVSATGKGSLWFRLS